MEEYLLLPLSAHSCLLLPPDAPTLQGNRKVNTKAKLCVCHVKTHLAKAYPLSGGTCKRAGSRERTACRTPPWQASDRSRELGLNLRNVYELVHLLPLSIVLSRVYLRHPHSTYPTLFAELFGPLWLLPRATPM